MHTSQSSGRAAACVFCTSLQLSKELKFWLDNRNSEKGKVLNVWTIIDPVGFLEYILRSPNYLKKIVIIFIGILSYVTCVLN